MIAYGCEGVGYIISGTFLVSLVQNIPFLSGFSTLSWMFVGLAAIPSCIIWSAIGNKWGHLKALQAAFFLQIIGVLLPVIVFNSYGALIGSLLFGATFMGMTALFMAEVKNSVSHKSNQLIGLFTGVYGIGQVIGPIIAGVLITHSGNYDSSFIFSAIVLFCGMIFLVLAQKDNHLQEREGSSKCLM